MIYANGGQLILQLDAAKHPIIIREDRRYRWLCFQVPYVQAVMDLQHPEKLTLEYLQAMAGCRHFLDDAQQCLIFGLGGGSLIRYLHHEYPDLQMHVVEICEELTAITKKYFPLPKTDKLTIEIADANDYLSKSSKESNKENTTHNNLTHKKTDLLLIDIYEPSSLPNCLLEENFYRRSHDLLTANGVMAINLLCDTNAQFLHAFQHIRHIFNSQTLSLPTKKHNNIIVYAFKNSSYKKKIMSLQEDGIIIAPYFDQCFGLCAEEVKLRSS